MNKIRHSRTGSAMVLGLVMVVMISGLVAAYLMTSLARGRNAEDAAEYQEALYVAQAGISKARWMLAVEDDNVPTEPNESYSFYGTVKNGTYYVTLTRKTDSLGNSADSLEDEEEDEPEPEPEPDPEPEVTDDTIDSSDWEIVDGRVVADVPTIATIKVLGAQISYGGDYPVMVTFRYRGESDWIDPYNFDSPTGGNLQDTGVHTFETSLAADEGLSIQGRSWIMKSHPGDIPENQWDDWWPATDDNDWKTHLTKDSDDNNGHVLVLRDGDETPPYNPLFGQEEISALIADYIDEDGVVHLDANEAIYIYELGQTQASDTSSDFQDLVVLVELRADLETINEQETTWAFSMPASAYDRLDSSVIFEMAQSAGLDVTSARLEITRTDFSTWESEVLAADFDVNSSSGIEVDFGDPNISESDVHTAVVYVTGKGIDAEDAGFGANVGSDDLDEPVAEEEEEEAAAEDDSATWVSDELEGMYEIVSTGVVGDARQSLTAAVDLRAGVWDGELPEEGVVLANDDLTLNGVTLSGDGGGAHTNAYGYVSGTVDVALYFDSVQTLTISGTLLVGGDEVDQGDYVTEHSLADPVVIPDANAGQYLGLADYVLVSEGSYEGQILVVSSQSYVEPETLGWRYGDAVGGGAGGEGEGETETVTQVDNTTVIGNFNGGILCEGSLTISGSMEGELPNVHTNGDGHMSGGANCVVSGTFTAAGNLSYNGNPQVEGGTMDNDYADDHSNAAEVEIPVYTAADFKDHCDYHLISEGSNAGKIYIVESGEYVATNAVANYGWQYKSSGSAGPRWILKYPSAYQAGMYHADCKVNLNQNGTFQITVVAEDRVNVGSNMNIAPFAEDLGILTDAHIDMQSNSDLVGIYYAGTKVEMTGTGSITGQIVALGDGSELGGNFTVTGVPDLVLPENDAEGIEVAVEVEIQGGDDFDEDMTGVWELFDEDTAASGIYYGDCRAIVSASVGSTEDPFMITLALTGSLHITGNCHLEAATEDLLIVAEGDLVTDGSPTFGLTGIVHVGEQFDIGGTMTLSGLLMSADQADEWDYAEVNKLEGNHEAQRPTTLQLPSLEEDPELAADLKQLRKSTKEEESANMAYFE